MHCNQCDNENPDSNRFCGQCGAPLTAQVADGAQQKKAARNTAILNSFREDVERQRSELKHIRQTQGAEEERSTPLRDNTPPLSKIATAPPSFGAPETANRRSIEGWTPDQPVRKSGERLLQVQPGSAEPPITGPSFLGLSDPDPAADPLAYLYDEDDHRGHGRLWFAAIIAAAFVGFIVYTWRQTPAWQNALAEKAQQVWAQGTRLGAGSAQRNGAKADSAESPNSNAFPQNEAASPAASAGTPASESTAQPPEAITPPDSPQSTEKNAAGSAPKDAQPSPEVTEQKTETAKSQTKTTSSDAAPVDKQAAAQSKPRNPSPAQEPEEAPEQALVTRAEAYLYGRGVPKNCEQAMVYLRTAADRGNASARSKLGGLYATGHCVPMDRARAYNWFTLARRAGDNNVWLQQNMAMLWRQMTPDEKVRTMQAPK